MSKSVDETVFDYFSLLLQEPPTKPVIEADTKPILESKIAQAVKDTSPIKDTTLVGQSSSSLVSQTAQSKVEPTRRFAEPNTQVDKLALEKLLSAVSHANKDNDIQKQIKASAERVRIAISETEASVSVQPNVDDTPLQKNTLTNKEIKSLVDIKTDNSALAELKDAIIKHDKIAEEKAAHQLQQTGATPPSITQNLQEVLDDEFQVLFFNVAGLTLAVPLVSLGGIIKIEKINHLIGRPSWFKGVQTHRDTKINVVDTCAWVMPEKYTPELAQSVNYQYLVMLENSAWGLTCESLVNAVKIDKSHVNWREKPGKRPWLAGVVKQQMCGILHVQALIEMLDAGLGCQDSIDRG
ncbi:chemotaxis protein CheW [Shewanella inventionis]|uniref:Chemotaxis protein CheW n=1 Tax=Shewanella inventionis TaxID=1738770 RepID=A0ABQ1IQB1_9GAMM|nr:chemotaxis protein CheW [Shewanella inventionis]MCL1156753.1 chemotaxis protein CheW [Shewanella inventionis]GGB49940.1 chemotaxis protein CheW [Shewanella inventionis]